MWGRSNCWISTVQISTLWIHIYITTTNNQSNVSTGNNQETMSHKDIVSYQSPFKKSLYVQDYSGLDNTSISGHFCHIPVLIMRIYASRVLFLIITITHMCHGCVCGIMCVSHRCHRFHRNYRTQGIIVYGISDAPIDFQMMKTLNGTNKHAPGSLHLNGADMAITTRVQFLNDPQGPLQPWGPLILDEDYWPNLQTVLKQRTSVGWQRTEILFDPQMPKLLHKVIAVTQTQYEIIGTGTGNLWRFGNNRSANKKVRGRQWDPSISVIPYKVQGREFEIPSISTRTVSSPTLVRDLLPTDFLKEILTHLINRSHQPPPWGTWSNKFALWTIGT